MQGERHRGSRKELNIGRGQRVSTKTYDNRAKLAFVTGRESDNGERLSSSDTGVGFSCAHSGAGVGQN